MTKDILLRISGVQFPDGEVNAEVLEEAGGVVRNLLKINDDSMELTRRGAANVHMVFEKDKKNESYYDTPFGNLLVGVSATCVDIRENEDSLDVKVKYALEINYEFMTDCTISISAHSK